MAPRTSITNDTRKSLGSAPAEAAVTFEGEDSTARVETAGSIAELRDEWDALAKRLEAPPFLGPGWVSSWWRAFGDGTLRVLALRRGDVLAGVLPVAERRGRLTSPTNWHTPMFGPLAADAAATSGLFAALFASEPQRIDLAFMQGSAASALSEEAGSYRIAERIIMRSPFVAIDGDWDSYWGGLSRNLRGTVRRCRNRLEELGPVSVDVSGGEQDLDGLLAEGLRVEASGWKSRAGTAILSRPETREFYETLSREAARAGTLRLAFLRIGGRAVAFNLCLESDSVHYLLKLGHDSELDRMGPGTVLAAEMIRRAFALKLDSYEFLGGADAYKLRWASGQRSVVRVQAFAPGLRGASDRLMQTRGRAAAKRILALVPSRSRKR
jgi:CelD/BcsL family acetyltransferase involved in cellulose biosynthesis